MQRLVAIRLGNGDIILEFARHRFVKTVREAQRTIAGIRLVDDDTKSINVEHLGKRQMFVEHFLVNAVEMLFAPRHAPVQPLLLQSFLDRGADFIENLLAVATGLAHRLGENAITDRIQRRETQIFQFQA